MHLLKNLIPVFVTGLTLLCSIQNLSAVDIKVRRFGSSSEFDNDKSPAISDSTNFGNTQQSTMLRRFQFKPTGSGKLIIYSVVISGNNASDFSILGFPGSISSSWNTFYVQFNPASSGTKTAKITIKSNSEDDPEFVINLRATATGCLPGNNIETAPGLHVSSRSTNVQEGWTCYCNSSNKLLLALKSAELATIIPANGIELKIENRKAEYFSHGKGFVGNIVGFTGVTKTWAIHASAQPISPVRARLYFTMSDTSALSDTMQHYTGIGLNRLSNIMFYNVTNNNVSKHATIATLRQNDIVVYDNGVGTVNWREAILSEGIIRAELELNNLHTIGMGASPGGITPLPLNFINQSAKPVAEGVRIAWQVLAEEGDVRFIIERADEGNRFIPVGTIYSNPSFVQGQVASYAFVDQTPLKTEAWTSYRITAVAVNGEKRMTPVMMVKSGMTNPSFHIYQSEKSNDWLVKMPAEATGGTIEMLDMKGNRVHFKEYHAAEEQQLVKLNPGNLQNGVYIVRIADMAAGIHTRRIVQREFAW